MSFLSSEILEKRIPEEEIILKFNPDRIKSAAYELGMGEQAYVTTDETKKIYKKGDQIIIQPGQFAVLITEETLKIPNDLIAFISIKFGIKFRGLVNVSGFHVDPGFNGRLKFSVFNAGSKKVVIDYGKPIFQIWFSKLSSPDSYEGKHNNQSDITNNDVMNIEGEITTPSALSKRIDDIESKFETLKSLSLGILVALVILIISIIVSFFINGS